MRPRFHRGLWLAPREHRPWRRINLALFPPPSESYTRIMRSYLCVPRPTRFLFLLAFLFLWWGCSGQQPQSVSMSAAAPGAGLKNYIGTWKGRCTSDVTAGVFGITFQVSKTGTELTGNYTCTPITINCRNNVNTGTLRGRTDNPSFQITLEDSSWCVFQPNFFSEEGQYSCYSQGFLVDHGLWRTHRADALPSSSVTK